MKFSFNPHDIKNIKSKISESLVDFYIHEDLIPRLKIEGFGHIFKTNLEKYLVYIGFPLSTPIKKLVKGEEVSRKFWEKWVKECVGDIGIGDEHGQSRVLKGKEKVDYTIRDHTRRANELPDKLKRLYLQHGVYPSSKLLDSTIDLLCKLDVWTDGILFKMKETGLTISEKKAYESRFFRDQSDGDKKFPVVDGELEIIEVKFGKAHLPSHQVKNYAEIVRKGYPLRFFHVEITSFENNQFEIDERLITNPHEIKSQIKF